MGVSRRVATSQWKEQWTVLKLAETKTLGNTGNTDDNSEYSGIWQIFRCEPYGISKCHCTTGDNAFNC